MARRQRHVPQDSSRRRLWVYIAVAVFIIVDVILILWALSSTRADENPEANASLPIPTFTAVPSSPTPEPTAAPQSTTIVAIAPTRIIAALDDTTAWRSTTGACPATLASPELTTDSGSTWKVTDATGPTEVTALQRIIVTSESLATMVGLAQTDCAPQLVRTYIAGDNFSSYPDELASAWYVNPADRATVHSPSGDFTAPCASIIALAPRDENAAAVLCADNQVFATADAAASWSEPATVSGAVNLAATEAGYLAAAVGRAECAGVQVLALPIEPLTATPTGCLPLVEPAETLPGNVALSEASGTVWLWAGGSVVRSPDGGVTWQ